MRIQKTIVVGDSHLQAVKKALDIYRPADLGEVMIDRFERVKDGIRIDGWRDADLKLALAATESGDMVVSIIGGNQYNSIGLLQHPVEFDFHDIDDPEDRIAEGVQIIPAKTIEEALNVLLAVRDTKVLAKLVRLSHVPVLSIESPPPKEDEDFILQKAESHFRNNISQVGVSKAGLRLKLWRVQSRLLRRICKELGVVFVPCPLESLNERGFLKTEYYGPDATHANGAYGVLVLNQIAEHARAAAPTAL